MRQRKSGLVAAVVVLALGTGWLATRGADAEAPAPTPVHTDPAAMAEGVVQAFDALLRDDLPAAHVAIKRLNTACRRMTREEDTYFAQGFFNRDQALHKVLDGTMGFIVDGRPEDAYTEFLWVTRTCRECHALAAKAGFLPKEGPKWEAPAGGFKRVETTHKDEQAP